MKLLKSLFVGIIICLSVISCDKENGNPDNIEITGTIQKQGITSYQYGTHTISGYALRSTSVDLDNYINQNITVVGYKIDGYPIDGGPDYIEVEEIK
jgi:hypothetical protein